MTVQEAIAWLNLTKLPLHGETSMGEEVINMAIKSLEEVEQYRALGTVEELKEAREKQIPKTPNIEGDGYADGHLVYDTWICPNCEEYYEIDYDDYDYCPKCGQKINKSVIEGSEEDA
jgi:rubrerythrin